MSLSAVHFVFKNLGSLEIRILDLQMHFVWSYSANASTVIDSLLKKKNIFIRGGSISVCSG